MTGQEKFDSCEFRSTFPVDIYVGCRCQNNKRQAWTCQKKNIADVKPVENCEKCDFYKKP